MGLVGVNAIRRQLGLALPVIAVVAHVLRVVLFGAVAADKDFGGTVQVGHPVEQRKVLDAGYKAVVLLELLLAEVALLEEAN